MNRLAHVRERKASALHRNRKRRRLSKNFTECVDDSHLYSLFNASEEKKLKLCPFSVSQITERKV